MATAAYGHANPTPSPLACADVGSPVVSYLAHLQRIDSFLPRDQGFRILSFMYVAYFSPCLRNENGVFVGA